MTLHQHLGNTGCTTEVSINLEGRMGIEEVGIGATGLSLLHERRDEVQVAVVAPVTVSVFSVATSLPPCRAIFSQR